MPHHLIAMSLRTPDTFNLNDYYVERRIILIMAKLRRASELDVNPYTTFHAARCIEKDIYHLKYFIHHSTPLRLKIEYRKLYLRGHSFWSDAHYKLADLIARTICPTDTSTCHICMHDYSVDRIVNFDCTHSSCERCFLGLEKLACPFCNTKIWSHDLRRISYNRPARSFMSV